ncbi:TPA: hypothetical protein SI477_003678 [Escherichia coli]|uniref:hypothetical protein n=1 Tax=Escherichia coli TaxID=562 RepID=UPI0005A929B6|nr:hypothetical protein [Escherichia coli]EAT2663380.1 hypothetical protein [Salmonella enterica]ATB80885.1 hypothetical protein CNQ55_26185 [Escherichia coli]EBM1913344.1 hypothetical protein [Salmonella enterica]EEZ9092927.1 hypothetical protein [Escherichia coli]EEZ9097524.1 hypothetical protein [Escherichia coli]
MKVIIATRNRYMEYGLLLLLKGHRVILAREFFMPQNRRCILEYDESWLIISDASLGWLMECMFHGRYFLQLSIESIVSVEQIKDAMRNSAWIHKHHTLQLSMSEMVVMFGYVFRELNTCYLAREMGIHAKTVNSFLYKGMAKNGLQGVSVKRLAYAVNKT